MDELDKTLDGTPEDLRVRQLLETREAVLSRGRRHRVELRPDGEVVTACRGDSSR
jgi:hypothetical protein